MPELLRLQHAVRMVVDATYRQDQSGIEDTEATFNSAIVALNKELPPIQHHYLEIVRYSPPGHEIRWWAQCSCGWHWHARSSIREAEKDRAYHASQYPQETVHL